MRKKQYFEGIKRLKELCRRQGLDRKELKQVAVDLRELQALNPRVDSETLVDAWEALENAEWTRVMSYEKDDGIDYGFEEPLFV